VVLPRIHLLSWIAQPFGAELVLTKDVSNRATNDVKMAFVKGLNAFNARLAEIASARNKNAAPDKSVPNSQQSRQ
jgi:hypothetical protein